MVETMSPLSTLLSSYRWLGQVLTPTETVPPETASVLFSGPQFFVALISGVMLAFAIQLLLTNFSVAAGISYLGWSSDSDASSDSSDSKLSIRKIGFGLGLWTLISVTLALFFACYLAVQLSLLTASSLGAIVGLVIWAAYFSLLVWVSSSTVGSLIGSVVNAATSGFQSVLGVATAAIGSKVAKQQVVSTAEAVTAAVRNELGSAIDPDSIRHSVEHYVQRLQLPSFDLSRVQHDFETLLNDPELAALVDGDRLSHIDRQTFIDLVSKRTDFSKEEVNRLASILETVWYKTLGQRSRRDATADLISYLQRTQPGQLKIDEVNAKLERILAERQQEKAANNAPGPVQQTLQSGITTLVGLLAGRTDLSDLNLEKIVSQLKTLPDKVSEQTAQVTGETRYNPIQSDLDHYLLTQYSWQMKPETVRQQVRAIFYDPSADPGSVARQVAQINRSFVVERLASRGVFTTAKIQQIADQIEAVRQEVQFEAQTAAELEMASDLKRRVEIYLTLTPKEQLYTTETLPAFESLLSDDEADHATLSARLAGYDRTALQTMLLRRADLTPDEMQGILNALERTRDRVLFNSQSLDEQAKETVAKFQERLSDQLRNTGRSELNPEGIKRDVQLLLHDPALGLKALKHRAARFDRETWIQLLRQRNDISDADVQQIVDSVESSWDTFIHAPGILSDTVKDRYDQTLSAIADYLRRTNLDELNPDGIQRDLKRLLDDPKEGAVALRRRLSKVDRETLVRLLSQRQDLSEAQVNRAIDQVQEALHQMVRAPRRLAMRTQQRVMEFEASVEEYLRNTDKEELNPEGIKRDLNLLVQSPQAGLQNLGDRLSHFDRSTLIALLSQRQDLSPQEAERIVSQIESVRDQILDQMRQVQLRIQSIIDRIFARIRDYLNGLDRPELNYDSIRQDIRTLFDDPQAGFDALRTRLSQFDRGTLVAILSSRRDISEQDANRIVDQIESARNTVLQRAERIQMEAQRRLEEVKLQAQRQMEETRKAAATAAWWLFTIALISAAASAWAGALAAA